ncbi:MAG: hypothetical protein ABI769_18080 [Pseudomonadota bacterium]
MPESNPGDRVKVWCRLPYGFTLTERSSLAADAKTTRVRLQHGFNPDVPRVLMERLAKTPDPKLSIRRVPILGYVIERKT